MAAASTYASLMMRRVLDRVRLFAGKAHNMLFHATHVQNLGNPGVHSPEASEALRRIINGAGEDGVKVQGVYANGPAHTLFVLLEADSDDHLDQFLAPIRELGDVKVVPVCDGRACLKR